MAHVIGWPQFFYWREEGLFPTCFSMTTVILSVLCHIDCNRNQLASMRKPCLTTLEENLEDRSSQDCLGEGTEQS